MRVVRLSLRTGDISHGSVRIGEEVPLPILRKADVGVDREGDAHFVSLGLYFDGYEKFAIVQLPFDIKPEHLPAETFVNVREFFGKVVKDDELVASNSLLAATIASEARLMVMAHGSTLIFELWTPLFSTTKRVAKRFILKQIE